MNKEKYEILVEAKNNLSKCAGDGKGIFICLEVKTAIGNLQGIGYCAAGHTAVFSELESEILSYMPIPSNYKYDFMSWDFEQYLSNVKPDIHYSREEIQAMRHAIIDKMIFAHASEAQKKVMILERVKANMKTSDTREDNGHYFICYGVYQEVCNLLERYDSIGNEITGEVMKQLNGAITVNEFLFNKLAVSLTFEEVMNYRHKILDELIAKYREEAQNEGQYHTPQ